MEEAISHSRTLRQTLRRFIAPHGLVFSSEGVKEIFARFGLSTAQFLRPFGIHNSIIKYDPFPENKDNTTGKANYSMFLYHSNIIVLSFFELIYN